jgi:hypothetical protein
MKTSQLAICTVATGMLMSTSFATPVQWTIEEGGNGHWYETIHTQTDICWSEAKSQSEELGGYLVTITTQEEQDFVATATDSSIWSWMGGWKNPKSGWEWITGEPWSHANWHPNEPSGDGPALVKDYGNNHPLWNDTWDCNVMPGFIIEYDELPEELPSLARAKIIAGGGYGWGIAIQQDGTLAGWGQNLNNVLEIPTDLTDGSRRVVKVDAWGWHAMALTEDGTVYAWGKNDYGQCNIPAGLGTCIDISGGGDHSLAVREDGTVWAWGNPAYNATNVPTGLSGVVEIQAGNVHQIYLLEDGTIGGFGHNYNCQCCVPSSVVQSPIDFDATESWSMAISEDGLPSVWGFNTGSYPPIDGCNTCIPSEATNVVDMAAGHYFAMALTESGNIVAWGDNDSGQCSPPADLNEVVMIHANQDTAFAVHPDGSVTGWGNGAGADVPSDLRVWLLDEVINDCNGNEVSDYEDIAIGYSEDLNENYVPDECECLADVDGNNSVDTLDLLLVIARWEQPGPIGDVNFSGYVDVNDLLYIVDSWGGCP